MTNLLQGLFLAFILVHIISCSPEQSGLQREEELSLKEIAGNLPGKWQCNSGDEIITETWSVITDSLYNGTTSIITNTDTFFMENIRLEKKGTEIYYIPQVSNQNGGLPIPFKMTSATKEVLIFENPDHDFPQKITYTFISADSVVATVSGEVENRKEERKFEMHRVTPP